MIKWWKVIKSYFIKKNKNNKKNVLKLDENLYILKMRQKVINYAIQVFGGKDFALSWLNSFNPLLGDAPINLLSTESGCDLVLNAIWGIEQGCYFENEEK